MRLRLGELRRLLREAVSRNIFVSDEVTWVKHPKISYAVSLGTNAPSKDAYWENKDKWKKITSPGTPIPSTFWAAISAYDGNSKPSSGWVPVSELSPMSEQDADWSELENLFSEHLSFMPLNDNELVQMANLAIKFPEDFSVTPKISQNTVYRAVVNLPDNVISKITNGSMKPGTYEYEPSGEDTSWTTSFDFLKRWILKDASTNEWSGVMVSDTNDGVWLEANDPSRWNIPSGEIVCCVKPTNVKITVAKSPGQIERLINVP